MIEESNNMNEFEQALREGFEAEALKVGDVIEGTIVAIHGDVALVDVSGKSEAVLERAEIDDWPSRRSSRKSSSRRWHRAKLLKGRWSAAARADSTSPCRA
jgi:hypothetical protein